jgi:transposase
MFTGEGYIAKNVFQVHAIDRADKVVVRKQLRRSQLLDFFKALPACLVGMEAWATRIIGRVNSQSLATAAQVF